jgi:DNA-binding NtrC family response regulator
MADEIKDISVLVIEDEGYMQVLMKDLLETAGITKYDIVPTTKEGLKSLDEKKYDLMFTDLNQTPDGVKVYEKGISKGIESYIMSGGADNTLLSQAKETAKDHFILRPFNFEYFMNILFQAQNKEIKP